jgi:hypothetical protein
MESVTGHSSTKKGRGRLPGVPCHFRSPAGRKSCVAIDGGGKAQPWSSLELADLENRRHRREYDKECQRPRRVESIDRTRGHISSFLESSQPSREEILDGLGGLLVLRSVLIPMNRRNTIADPLDSALLHPRHEVFHRRRCRRGFTGCNTCTKGRCGAELAALRRCNGGLGDLDRLRWSLVPPGDARS